jgi:hypothetical protein
VTRARKPQSSRKAKTALALIVEGESDYEAIPILLRNAGLSVASVMQIGGQSIDCDMYTLVKGRLLGKVQLTLLRQPSKVLVVLDRESRNACPGEFAGDVQNELVRQLGNGYRGTPRIVVVCADRTLENWLLADPDGIGKHNYIARDCRNRIRNNADGVNAEALLKWAYAKGRSYHKRRDAPDLALRVRSGSASVRRRSKSLDKLLREASA